MLKGRRRPQPGLRGQLLTRPGRRTLPGWGRGRERPHGRQLRAPRREQRQHVSGRGGGRGRAAIPPSPARPLRPRPSSAARGVATFTRPGGCGAAAWRAASRAGGAAAAGRGGPGQRRVYPAARVRLPDGARRVRAPPAAAASCPLGARLALKRGRPWLPGATRPARDRRVAGARVPERAAAEARGGGRERERERGGREGEGGRAGGRGRGACRTLDRSSGAAAAEREPRRAPPSPAECRDRGGRAVARIAETAERGSRRLPDPKG